MEEVFSVIADQIFSLLFAPIGIAYLFLRYRTKVRIQQVLASEYENSYSNAGQAVVLNSVAAVGALQQFSG